MPLSKIYTICITLVALVSITSAFNQQNQRPKFEEIDVERINIVEKDGKLRMVISNRERQHPGSVDGQLVPRPHGRPPGVLFFNHRGDECGGLVFDENGGQGHFVSLTMDKSRNDQTVGMQHLESDNGQYFAGLRIWDRPHSSLVEQMKEFDRIEQLPDDEAKKAAYQSMKERGELGAERVTVAKLRDSSAVIALRDQQGRTRIRISVDGAGNPKLDFLDEGGKAVYSLPDKGSAAQQ